MRGNSRSIRLDTWPTEEGQAWASLLNQIYTISSIHTYIQPSSHIALLLPYLKSDYLTYCNPSCCPQDKSQAIKPTVCYRQAWVSFHRTDIYDIKHTYIQPSLHITLLLLYLKSDYLTYCNPSCCPLDNCWPLADVCYTLFGGTKPTFGRVTPDSESQANRLTIADVTSFRERPVPRDSNLSKLALMYSVVSL